jgi:hypothetical protein
MNIKASKAFDMDGIAATDYFVNLIEKRFNKKIKEIIPISLQELPPIIELNKKPL